ncbi:hypothetical protein [Burkholderia diffusa]|uniref:hypothetical protein n=1 Tax=Burkholderia diffusa TaxID=488732 RepID=UPI0015821782|nr:hypothetical protein [Burkholderia diffusa]
MNYRLSIQCAVPFLLLIFGKPTWPAPLAESNRVVIAVDYGSRDLTRLHQLEDELDLLARETKSGELDGDEVAVDGSKASIYMNCADTRKLIETIRHVLKAHDFSRNARISVGS